MTFGRLFLMSNDERERTMSALQKRRIREAKRRAAELETKHQQEIELAKRLARDQGHAEGRQQGARTIRDQVLEHAGRLYKEGRDDAAKAVRDVQRLLPTSV